MFPSLCRPLTENKKTKTNGMCTRRRETARNRSERQQVNFLSYCVGGSQARQHARSHDTGVGRPSETEPFNLLRLFQPLFSFVSFRGGERFLYFFFLLFPFNIRQFLVPANGFTSNRISLRSLAFAWHRIDITQNGNGDTL